MRLWRRFLLAWMVVVVFIVQPFSLLKSQASPAAQANESRQKALNLMVKMSPEERVGQLFLVTFIGNGFDESAQIYDLITKHHVGGVMLTRANDNIGGAEETPAQMYRLNRTLQESEWKGAQGVIFDPISGVSMPPNYIPLFIGISQEGDFSANDQIITGLTPLPSLMSIGATWNPELARQVGEVMGKELRALGFNLFIGPSLDVLDLPQMDNGEDLGVRTFGGDPYWTGKLGQTYIKGLHQGSGNQMAVIAKHFPGRGGSDRSPEEEIATVRKSLEQLKQIELAPFFAVTGSLNDTEMVADGLFVSHIRYQGFQGNIRATTRPVSSDAAALDLILKLPPFADWRLNGGLMVSDNLGSQAVRRFYDPTGNAFDARTAAREAFFAGNDLLYVDRFLATNDPDSYTTIVRTMDFFAQKYREDDAFAQRVDASVERILTMKYRLFPTFSLEEVVPPLDTIEDIGSSQQVTFEIARRSMTLISPSAAELPLVLPQPPGSRDRIVFLSEVLSGRQCSACAERFTLQSDSLQSAVLRLYGPYGSGQVSQSLMSSYSFTELWRYLSGSPEQTTLPDDIRRADWIVVSMNKPSASQPESQAFRRLLSERPDFLRSKKVVVFAFNAPYYLDATDISKLTAYYGLYSKSEPFVEVAARVLFQELVPEGALPVTVPGVGYDLIQVTSPDPAQVIPLFIDQPGGAVSLLTATQRPTPAPNFQVNEIIPLRTGMIYDHNGNQVPDGTPVRFLFSSISTESGSSQQQIETVTIDGVARAMYRIERSGILEIVAVSETGARSSLLRLDTVSGGVTVVPPTAVPTETPTMTPTVAPTETPTPTPTVMPPPPPTIGMTDWFSVLLLVVGSAAGIAWLGIRAAVTRWGLRWALCGVIGGLLAYNYIAFRLPGSESLLSERGTSGVVAATLIGVILGWLAGLIWKQIISASAPSRTGERSVTGPKSQSS